MLFLLLLNLPFLQLFSEKISGAEGTKLDEEFQEMERVRQAALCFSILSYCRVKHVSCFESSNGIADLHGGENKQTNQTQQGANWSMSFISSAKRKGLSPKAGWAEEAASTGTSPQRRGTPARRCRASGGPFLLCLGERSERESFRASWVCEYHEAVSPDTFHYKNLTTRVKISLDTELYFLV